LHRACHPSPPLRQVGCARHGPGEFVRQAVELYDILDVMRGELLQYLLIPYSLTECNHNRSNGNTWDDVANLEKLLDEGVQTFCQALLHDVEVSLISRP
jgi:hypothetical protein